MHRQTAVQIRRQFLEKKISAKEIAEHFLKRIADLDDKVGAYLSVFNEKALERAHKLDQKLARGEPLGKLAGVPVAIKDNIHLTGELTTCASKFLTNYRAPFSATAVQLLLDEDALLIGKTNLDEFAMGSSTEHSALKVTKNPWNLSCVPGGSSGGSAAAVAARLAPIALGSDTGGSIRQPASFCGVVGLKPTYGRISRFGLVAFGSSLDQIGPITTSVEDAALALEVMGKPCQKDSTSLPQPPVAYSENLWSDLKGCRVGVPASFLKDLKGETKENFEASLKTLTSLGASIVEVDLSLLEYAIPTYYILATAEASTNLARFDGIRYGKRSERAKTLDEVYDFSKEEGFGKEVKMRILLGTFVLSSGYQDAFYKKAQKVRTLIIEQYQKAFKQADIIAMPVSPFPTFEFHSIQDPLQMYLADIYTISANLAGLPAISVPSGFTAAKKPLGLQLTGPLMEDKKVLDIANAFEKATLFTNQYPDLA